MLDAGSLWCIVNRSYLSCSLVSFTVIKELDIRKRVGLVSLSVRAQSSLEVRGRGAVSSPSTTEIKNSPEPGSITRPFSRGPGVVLAR